MSTWRTLKLVSVSSRGPLNAITSRSREGKVFFTFGHFQDTFASRHILQAHQRRQVLPRTAHGGRRILVHFTIAVDILNSDWKGDFPVSPVLSSTDTLHW
jgi:hypothetical protein